MNRLRMSSILMGLILVSLARAQPSVNAQREIEILLSSIGSSGCEYYRNGTWSDSQSAETHLRDKYKYFVAKNQINSAEEFIERAATGSIFSGQAYQVKCHGSAAVPSKQWLSDKLTRIRAF